MMIYVCVKNVALFGETSKNASSARDEAGDAVLKRLLGMFFRGNGRYYMMMKIKTHDAVCLVCGYRRAECG